MILSEVPSGALFRFSNTPDRGIFQRAGDQAGLVLVSSMERAEKFYVAGDNPAELVDPITRLTIAEPVAIVEELAEVLQIIEEQTPAPAPKPKRVRNRKKRS